MAQFEACVGQLGLGLPPRELQLLDAPLRVIQLRLGLGAELGGPLDGLGGGRGLGLEPGGAADDQEQGTNAPIVQINTARNGNSEMPGPGR